MNADAMLSEALTRVDRWLASAGEGVGGDGNVGALIAALAADHAPAEPPRIIRPDEPCALPTLQRAEQRYGLTSLERDVVLLALAPELDDRYGAVLAAMQGDPQRRRPTVGLAIRLFEHRIAGARLQALAALGPEARMCRLGLLDVVGDGPHAGRELRLRPEFWPRLVGQAAAGELAARRLPADHLDALILAPADRDLAAAAVAWARARPLGDALIAISGPDGSGRTELAAAILAGLGLGVIAADGAMLDTPDAVRALTRDAVWHGAGVVVIGATAVALSRLARDLPAPIVAVVDPASARALADAGARPVLAISLTAPDAERRAALWRAALAADAGGEDISAAELAHRYRFGPQRIAATVALARATAAARGDRLATADLRTAASAGAGPDAGSLAHRVEVDRAAADLVVPASTRAELDVVALWARHGGSAFGPGAPGYRIGAVHGLIALFAGAPGTGKTLAARILARDLGLELWRIDLSQVVNKYLGETEKNLDRVLAAADAEGAIVFFDEADALFGKRTEVRDAHDRYANVETAFLLQRLEAHHGVVILATNLEANLDPAFIRRIQVIARFPLPGAAERLEIWRRHLDPAHLDQDVELGPLATRFAIAGGDIRNAAVTAVLLAADERTRIAMRHLVRAVWRELRKVGRLISADELGPWRGLIAEAASAAAAR
jgi:hypothetical protein